MQRRQDALYPWLCGLFVAALITADLVGGKLFRVAGHDLSAGMLAFPLTFLLTDVINEFYGARATRRVTYIGLGAALFALGIIWLAARVPTSPESPLSSAEFHKVFGWSIRLYFASLTAYLVGQLLDIAIFSGLRRLTRTRWLWLRATGSTLASQWIDTLVVSFGMWSGHKPSGYILALARDSYVIKVVVALALTPLIYAVHAVLQKLLRAPASAHD